MGRRAISSRRQPRKDPVASARRRRDGIPAEETNLTPAERKLLPDPDRVTEDDADAIIAHRRRKEPTVSLDEYLRRRGHELAH